MTTLGLCSLTLAFLALALFVALTIVGWAKSTADGLDVEPDNGEYHD